MNATASRSLKAVAGAYQRRSAELAPGVAVAASHVRQELGLLGKIAGPSGDPTPVHGDAESRISTKFRRPWVLHRRWPPAQAWRGI